MNLTRFPIKVSGISFSTNATNNDNDKSELGIILRVTQGSGWKKKMITISGFK